MTKESTVAVVYHCLQESKRVIINRQKLQRRLQRAIEDMAEDGFTNFILPLIEYTPFQVSFIDAIIAEKSRNPNIRLIILLPYETEECFVKSPVERHRDYLQYADEMVSYPPKDVLEHSSALIIYYEKYCTQLRYFTNTAQQNQIPFININLL